MTMAEHKNGTRDMEKTRRLVKNIASGMTDHAAGVAAGYNTGYATKAAEAAMKDPELNRQVISGLRRTATTWRQLVEKAKHALGYNLTENNWKENGGEIAPNVRAQSAKIVLDSLRTIDADTLSEKAKREDTVNDVDAAKDILGEHGVN